MYKPPFQITSNILNLVAKIVVLESGLHIRGLKQPEPQLRKNNQVKTIQGTLSIEGNTLTEEQITAILNGQKVIGNINEIQEALNANELYQNLNNLKFFNIKDLLRAHKILMYKLIHSAGQFRSKNVGILKGTKVSHLAPKPQFVHEHITNLFRWAKQERSTHYLILSSILHYELEFIHPFEDGNGRVGRFWQTLTLASFSSIYQFVPMESIIKKNQKRYYKALEVADKSGESTAFIEFMLEIILKSLTEFSDNIIAVTATIDSRMMEAKEHFMKNEFSRKDYMVLHKGISSATASRDLKDAVENKILKKNGSGNQTKYRFESHNKLTESRLGI